MAGAALRQVFQVAMPLTIWMRRFLPPARSQFSPWLQTRRGLCCVCCAAPMAIQLTLGIMNPFVMMGVAAVIAAEKLSPRPEIAARIVGIFAVVAGIMTVARNLQTSL